jgi:hypothetical protein
MSNPRHPPPVHPNGEQTSRFPAVRRRSGFELSPQRRVEKQLSEIWLLKPRTVRQPTEGKTVDGLLAAGRCAVIVDFAHRRGASSFR